MSVTDNGKGYKIVGLRRVHNGRSTRRNHYVHRLVAEAFLRPISKKEVVNHIDYDTSNNQVSNLDIVTQCENVRYSSQHMRIPKKACRVSNTGEKYIRFKGGKYVLCIRNIKMTKTFKNLNDAVAYRNEVMNNVKKYHAG